MLQHTYTFIHICTSSSRCVSNTVSIIRMFNQFSEVFQMTNSHRCWDIVCFSFSVIFHHFSCLWLIIQALTLSPIRVGTVDFQASKPLFEFTKAQGSCRIRLKPTAGLRSRFTSAKADIFLLKRQDAASPRGRSQTQSSGSLSHSISHSHATLCISFLPACGGQPAGWARCRDWNCFE